MSVLIKSEREKDTGDGDRESEGIEEGIEKWNREVKVEGGGGAERV